MFCIYIYIAVRSLDKNREFCKDVPYIYITGMREFFFKRGSVLLRIKSVKDVLYIYVLLWEVLKIACIYILLPNKKCERRSFPFVVEYVIYIEGV